MNRHNQHSWTNLEHFLCGNREGTDLKLSHIQNMTVMWLAKTPTVIADLGAINVVSHIAIGRSDLNKWRWNFDLTRGLKDDHLCNNNEDGWVLLIGDV